MSVVALLVAWGRTSAKRRVELDGLLARLELLADDPTVVAAGEAVTQPQQGVCLASPGYSC